MKKIIALSLGLVCSAIYAADSAPAANSPLPTENNPPSSATAASSPSVAASSLKPSVQSAPVAACPCAGEESKPVVQKKVVKKKAVKKVAKKVLKSSVPVVATPALANESSGVLVQSDYFHVPDASSNKPLSSWEKKITYADVDVIMDTSAQGEVVASLMDKRTNKPLDKFSLKKLDVVNADVRMLSVKSNLSEINSASFDVSAEQNKFVFNPQHSRNSCEAIFLTYHLKTEKEPKTIKAYLDQKSVLQETLPSDCEKIETDNRETAFYTKSGYVVNLSNNPYFMSKHKTLSMDMHFTKEGHEVFPPALRAYAVARDFSSVHQFNPKPHAKGPYFGVNFNHKLDQGDYYFVVGFDYDQGTEWIQNKVEVR